ncbi:MAG: nitrilase-related carbon-nitrogen hydrolase [Nitriliruptoraceae bacterium]
MRVALAQVAVQLGDLDANLARAWTAIRSARDEGADVVIFPELHLSGYDLGRVVDDVALEATDPRLADLAAGGDGMGVLLCFPELSLSGVHTYNSAAYFQGHELVHVHRKLYLPTYDVFEERKHFSPGTRLQAYDTAAGRVATLICNDAWQPMLPFVAVHDGARVLFVPADSSQSRFPEHYDSPTYWYDLVSFYGRMYQCYVVFVNRVGVENPGTDHELRFWGRSHAVNPWGERLAEAADSEEDLLVVDLDPTAVRRRRREVPLLKEARLKILEREIRRLADEGGDL